jgi:hypothetical protein
MLTACPSVGFPSFQESVSYFLGGLIKKVKGAVKGITKRSSSFVGRLFRRTPPPRRKKHKSKTRVK